MLTKTLYIIRGISNAGKTTLAHELTEYSFASDEMPGLYIDGEYQLDKQAESHKWCFEQIENLMSRGLGAIAVHNTFDSSKYMQPYIDLAAKYDYTVRIIHCEGVYLPNGSQPKNDHNVPQPIVQAMINRWEPVSKPEKKAMSFADFNAQFADNINFPIPAAIICDFDDTLAKTRSGETFAISPEDVKPKSQCSLLLSLPPACKLFVASNQRGIQQQRKTINFLTEQFNNFLAQSNLRIEKAYFAPEKNSHKCLIRSHGDRWEIANLQHKADKPNPGIFVDIINSIQPHLDQFHPNFLNIWIVGDAHTQQFSSDWEFAIASQTLFPHIKIQYIPVEMLNIAIRLTPPF